jgi:hypothetical protein
MILVDSNIPMYLVGAEHPNKEATRRLLESAVVNGDRLVTDVEVLQEILHRYVTIHRWAAVQAAFDAILGVVDEVLRVELADVEVAKRVILGGYGLSARDALHVAVMQRHGIETIMSFDVGFDQYPGLRRLR